MTKMTNKKTVDINYPDVNHTFIIITSSLGESPMDVRKTTRAENTRVLGKPWFVCGHVTAHPTTARCDWLRQCFH